MTNQRWMLPLILALVCVSASLVDPPATAQILGPGPQTGRRTTLQFVCTGSTKCKQKVKGNSELVTTSGNPTFQITTQRNSGLKGGQAGTLFLVILVPSQSAKSLGNSFSVNGIPNAAVEAGTFGPNETLWSPKVLNFSLQGTSTPSFKAFRNASRQVLGKGVASFTLYTVNLGTVTAPKRGFANGTVLATVNSFGVNLPPGTVMYTVLVCGSTKNSTLRGLTAVNTSPLNESLTLTGLSATPEPTSMLLFGSGFVVLGGVLRRRFSNKT